MNNSNKKEFATLFYALGEYYDKKVSTELLSMLFDDLIEFDINEVKFGAKCHRQDPKHGTFFPKCADIIRHLQTSKISVEDKALLAWSQVIREIRATGSYGTLKLDDKQAMAAIKSLGSWQQLCSSTEKEMTWKKKEFMSNYQTYENTPIEFLPSSMPGRIELVEHKKDSSKNIKHILGELTKNRLNNT
ncbi:MAG: DUF6475 domain-containing protein [Methylococcales bacterium]